MSATKTLNPLHFEDLEPKRFEDLVRELLYDFRDWYKIEPTGRTGSDEGYDARAWEKADTIENTDESNEDEENGKHTLTGNLWKIQCKREKEIGPTRIKEIIEESIKGDEVPYGFFLAAPVNFSKKSYDAFAEGMRGKGVTEFFLWGKGDLEHALMMPKNDRILFAFFGISLLLRRRSKTTEIKFSVNNKNKLFRILGGFNNSHESVLLRDINDTEYPYTGKFKDDKTKQPWREQIMVQFHPKGLIFHVHEYYAYYNAETKEFNFTKAVDLVNRHKETLHQHQDPNNKNDWEDKKKVEYFYQHLPRKNQAKLHLYGLLSFDDMLLIDDKGDSYFDIPHIFVEYDKKIGPFTSLWNTLKVNGEEIELDKTIKETSIFPKVFPEIKRGTINKDKYIDWDSDTSRIFSLGNLHRFYDVDGKYSFLSVKDVIAVKAYRPEEEDEFAQVTHKYTVKVKDLLSEQNYLSKASLEKDVGRAVTDDDEVTVFEIVRVSSWELK